jgi:hypothetical protein
VQSEMTTSQQQVPVQAQAETPHAAHSMRMGV